MPVASGDTHRASVGEQVQAQVETDCIVEGEREADQGDESCRGPATEVRRLSIHQPSGGEVDANDDVCCSENDSATAIDVCAGTDDVGGGEGPLPTQDDTVSRQNAEVELTASHTCGGTDKDSDKAQNSHEAANALLQFAASAPSAPDSSQESRLLADPIDLVGRRCSREEYR